MDIFLNQLIQFYSNNTLNRRPLTPHIIPCYTYKMVIVDRDHRLRDVTSPMYRPQLCYARDEVKIAFRMPGG